jgi:hypothetical protein
MDMLPGSSRRTDEERTSVPRGNCRVGSERAGKAPLRRAANKPVTHLPFPLPLARRSRLY